MFEKVLVDLGDRSYSIVIGRGLVKTAGRIIYGEGLRGKIAVITNPVVGGLYLDELCRSLYDSGLHPFVVEIPDGEQYKSLSVAESVYDRLIDNRMERSSAIIALGGGVVGDLAGFVAATYLRGVPYIQMPSTLLAQVDSSVGGKTAVNHSHGKNLIGAFYQPNAVIADINFLESLELREVRSGMAEIIKYGAIKDDTLFAFIEDRVEGMLSLDDSVIEAVKRSCEIKSEIVSMDERESGLRSILNFGHTFGHAIESVTGYGRYRHGEAVAIGMLYAAELSLKMGICSEETVSRIEGLIRRTGLPADFPVVRLDELLRAMEMDKKVVDGKIRMVLLESIGKVRIVTMTEDELSRTVST